MRSEVDLKLGFINIIPHAVYDSTESSSLVSLCLVHLVAPPLNTSTYLPNVGFLSYSVSHIFGLGARQRTGTLATHEQTKRDVYVKLQ